MARCLLGRRNSTLDARLKTQTGAWYWLARPNERRVSTSRIAQFIETCGEAHNPLRVTYLLAGWLDGKTSEQQVNANYYTAEGIRPTILPSSCCVVSTKN
eukprot:scaffold333952_cov18-Prasinocladus_malaysianus.AAC.1